MQSPLDMSSLRNSGFLELGTVSAPPSEQTIVVLGVARGGTSMVAQALHAIGVPMGKKLSAVYEDMEICAPMEAGDRTSVREVILRKDEAHPKWGFKRPGAVKYVEQYLSELRNPCFVIVFRDVFAITNRNRLSVKQPPLVGLKSAAQQYVELVEFCQRQTVPMFLVSYEKALLDKVAFVHALAKFAGVDGVANLEQGLGAIDPGNDQYLDEARTLRSIGRLEGLSTRTVRGWAAFAGQKESVFVSVILNDRELGKIRANVPRPGLAGRHGLSDNGAHGFSYELPESISIRVGDSLRARVVGEPKDLGNCPIILGPVAARNANRAAAQQRSPASDRPRRKS